MADVGIKCNRCGSWYRTTARLETRFDRMTKTVTRWDNKTRRSYEEEVIADFPRVIMSDWGEHNCKADKGKGKYSYD